MRSIARSCTSAPDIPNLFGQEGEAASLYFGQFTQLLSCDADPEFADCWHGWIGHRRRQRRRLDPREGGTGRRFPRPRLAFQFRNSGDIASRYAAVQTRRCASGDYLSPSVRETAGHVCIFLVAPSRPTAETLSLRGEARRRTVRVPSSPSRPTAETLSLRDHERHVVGVDAKQPSPPTAEALSLRAEAVHGHHPGAEPSRPTAEALSLRLEFVGLPVDEAKVIRLGLPPRRFR